MVQSYNMWDNLDWMGGFQKYVMRYFVQLL